MTGPEGVGLVALDVDGTALGPDGRVAPSTRAAVAAARARSVHVVLATSRGPVALEGVQRELGLLDEWFVGFQGALVARREGGRLRVLAETRVPHAAAREVEDRALAAGLSVGRYVGTRWRVPRMTDAIRHEAAATGETPLLSGPEDADGDDAPHKLAVIAAGPHESGALRELAASLPPSVTAAVSHPCFLEVTAAGVDKATGLRPLAAHLGIRTDDAAAVGDGPNDLALFAAVGLPVAMGQAPPEVRAAAAWVTTSNAEDGVARALAHLGLTDEVVTPASAPVRTAP